MLNQLVKHNKKCMVSHAVLKSCICVLNLQTVLTVSTKNQADINTQMVVSISKSWFKELVQCSIRGRQFQWKRYVGVTLYFFFFFNKQQWN